jgi:hypothetical protein
LKHLLCDVTVPHVRAARLRSLAQAARRQRVDSWEALVRRSVRASRNRILAIGASVLLSGSALAAVVAVHAQADTALVANVIMLTSPGAQTTTPIATDTASIVATESDETATLTFAVTGAPAGPFTIAQPAAAGAATEKVTGAFTAPYTGEVTVTVTSVATAASLAGTKSITFAWTAGNTITFPTVAAQTTLVDTAVTGASITATDNDAAAALTYTSATLPTGLAISKTTGAISGTPTVPGTYQVTVTATDSTGATATSKAFTWTITPDTIAVKATPPAKAWVGVPVKVQPTATDSVAGQTVTWSDTSLPAGLTYSKTTGLISGRPTANGTKTTVVTATDGRGTTGSTTVTFTIAVGVVIANPGAQTTTVGRWNKISPIKTTDPVTGDKPVYTVSGLPREMGFQASPMLFFGWPTNAGTYTVVVHEKGSAGSIDTMKFKLTVKAAPDKGATGQIHLALDGKCLQDPSGKTANGTAVRIEKCASGANERFTVVADGTIRVNGRCLDVAGSGSSVGRQVVLDSCGKGNARQRWSQSTDGELVNPAAGLCVADAEASTSNGIAPTMSGCHALSYVQWTLPAQPVLTALGGSCADDHYDSGVNGNVVDMWLCNGSSSQAWTFEPGGTVRMFGNKCLTLRSKKAVLWTCGSSSGQKWTIDRIGTMTGALTQNGVCLAIPSMTAARGTALEGNGTQLIASKCSSSDPRDLWHVA